MPWFVRGDIDGFFGLALDNFVQLLLIRELCKEFLNFDDALLYGRVLPEPPSRSSSEISFTRGKRANSAHKPGRKDIAHFLRINTVSLFAHVFLVIAAGKSHRAQSRRRRSRRLPGSLARRIGGMLWLRRDRILWRLLR